MTKLEQAARQALKALEVFEKDNRVEYDLWDKSNACDTIVALCEALAEQDNEISKLGCVNHDCAGCYEKTYGKNQYSDIVSDGGLDPRNKFDTPQAKHQEALQKMADNEKELGLDYMAQHQEELNKFAEDSVWDENSKLSTTRQE